MNNLKTEQLIIFSLSIFRKTIHTESLMVGSMWVPCKMIEYINEQNNKGKGERKSTSNRFKKIYLIFSFTNTWKIFIHLNKSKMQYKYSFKRN